MATRTQDMPPPGGYAKIPFKRMPARVLFSGIQMFAGYVGITTAGFYLYYLNYKKHERDVVENRSGKIATIPLLMAERDREFLKQLRKNRDEEAELMKNVPGWEVGTWYGEPIFKTKPKDELLNPSWADFCAHADYKVYENRADFHLWN